MVDGQTRKAVSRGERAGERAGDRALRGERVSDRAARADDIHEIATSLPEVTVEGSPSGLPVYQVRGKSFVFFRGRRKDAIDPDTGEPMDDVVGIRTPSEEDKFALAQAAGPWFTTPHFKGYPAILIRLRDLGGISRSELAEVITDAWLSRAPKTVARRFEETLARSAERLDD